MNTSLPSHVPLDGPSTVGAIYAVIDAIDPKQYDRTRNFLDGAVTWLSPYLTHGIINTTDIAQRVLANHKSKACYRLLFELAWREYFHRVWQDSEDAIFADMQRAQGGVESALPPRAILNASTGVDVLDNGIEALLSTGRMHNHMRMWTAGLTCNLGHTHWLQPARWLYYHLLDGDLASNSLSWQWVAGTFSNKQYIANQDNLNKYSRTEQRDTWLDLSYEELMNIATPDVLSERSELKLQNQALPGAAVPQRVDSPIALRSIWNLNPNWRDSTDEQHVVFIERSQLEAWPMSSKRWGFINHWISKLNAQVWLGEVEELERLHASGAQLTREEYPACHSWPGIVEPRRFLYPYPESHFASFSQFWKQVKKAPL